MKVLIVKMSSMGDVIHTLPALTDAAKAIPGISFDWVVEEGFAEIPSWHPAVDKVISVAIRRWRKSVAQTVRSGEWRRFRRDLKSRHYDAVIDAQGLLKSALVTKMARGVSYGLDKSSAREPLAAKLYQNALTVSKQQHAVERVRQLFAQSLGYSVPERLGQFLLNKTRFSADPVKQTPYIVFVHGTTWPTKHWPDAYWCELAEKVCAAGFHVVIPWSNDTEQKRAQCIARAAENTCVLPRMNLAGIAGVLAHAVATVSVDTGLGHMTAALETPGISLYGPTVPDKVGAYGAKQVHITLSQCPERDLLKVEPEIFTPMTADVVWEKLESLLVKKTWSAGKAV